MESLTRFQDAAGKTLQQFSLIRGPPTKSDKQVAGGSVLLPRWSTSENPVSLKAIGWVSVPGLLMGASA